MHRTMIAVGVLAGLLVHSQPVAAQGHECRELCALLDSLTKPCTLRAETCRQLCREDAAVGPALQALAEAGHPDDQERILPRIVGVLLASEPTLWRCGAASPPAVGRPCRGDMFSIDLPMAAVSTDRLLTIGPRRLTSSIKRLPGAIDTLNMMQATGLSARIEPIFPLPGFNTRRGPDADALKASGYIALRHWRLTIVNRFGIPTHAPPGALCDIIDRAKKLLADDLDQGGAALGVDQIFVARECDAVPQQQDAPRLMERLRSPRPPPESVGVVASALDGIWGPIIARGTGPTVNVAIIDGPITTAHAEHLGARIHSVPGAGTFASGTADQMHAATVGAVLEPLAPNARLHFFRGLEADAGTPNGNVARALHAVMSTFLDTSSGDAERLVINMSLGWPPEYNAYEPLALKDGIRCVESPIGQSVYSALSRLAELQARKPGVVALAASGNRLLPAAMSSAASFAGPRFYPAQWGRGPVDWEASDGRALGVEAIGRIGFERRLDLPEAIASSDDFAAPGIHVPIAPPRYALELPGFARFDLARQPKLPRRGALARREARAAARPFFAAVPGLRSLIPELPLHATGTSISTAIASGVVAARLRRIPAGATVSGSSIWQDFSDCHGARVPAGHCPSQKAFDAAPSPSTDASVPWATSHNTKVELIADGESWVSGLPDKARTGGLGPQPPGGLCPQPPCHSRPEFEGATLRRLQIELKPALGKAKLTKTQVRVQWKDDSDLHEARVPLNMTLQENTLVVGRVPIEGLPKTPEAWKTATVQVVGMLEEPDSVATERSVWLKRIESQ